MSACDKGDIDYAWHERFTVVNNTSSAVKLFAADFSLSLEAGDSVRLDEFDPLFLCGRSPKGIEVGDSTVYLSDYPTIDGREDTGSWLCWHYNSQNEQIGEYEWMHTYVIDNQWIIDAWTESGTGRCTPGTKSTHYE